MHRNEYRFALADFMISNPYFALFTTIGKSVMFIVRFYIRHLKITYLGDYFADNNIYFLIVLKLMWLKFFILSRRSCCFLCEVTMNIELPSFLRMICGILTL